MKKLTFAIIAFSIFIACKKEIPKQNANFEICKNPENPFLFLEAENFEVEVQKSNSGIAPLILVANNSDALKNINVYSSNGTFGSLCPCNLPKEFKIVGLKLRVSGKSITNGDIVTSFSDKNGKLLTTSGPECIRFEISKVEKL